jgi:hypothetical protein
MLVRELHCETCDGMRAFEMPPCADGHGPDCPELLCTGCGTAIVVAPYAPLSRATPPARRALHPRHAA